jgi:hypothetical protein
MSAHGTHNKKVCEKLHAETGCDDWVVTTAFYSALHFIQAKIFPFTHNGVEIKSLEGAHKNDDLKRANKHATMLNLVSMRLPSQNASYRFLHDKCHNARYVNYRVDRVTADNAKFYLDGIINDCTPTIV